jgi:hypothetical protein
VRSSDMGSTLLRQLVSESRSPTGQDDEAVTVDVTQSGNRLTVQADHIEVFFEVEGIDLLLNTDPSVAVWALLPWAMEEASTFTSIDTSTRE